MVGLPRKLSPRKAGAGPLSFAGRYSSMFMAGPFSAAVKWTLTSRRLALPSRAGSSFLVTSKRRASGRPGLRP